MEQVIKLLFASTALGFFCLLLMFTFVDSVADRGKYWEFFEPYLGVGQASILIGSVTDPDSCPDPELRVSALNGDDIDAWARYANGKTVPVKAGDITVEFACMRPFGMVGDQCLYSHVISVSEVTFVVAAGVDYQLICTDDGRPDLVTRSQAGR